jgi:microcystin-dependent protein
MYAPQNAGGLASEVLQEFQFLSAKLRAWVAVDHNEDGSHNLRPSGFDFVPIGSMLQWGSNTAPERWLVCDGTAVSRTTYQGLFAVIGTTYGAGDASTTFNLPDFRQRVPLGKAASGTGSTLGSTGGAIDHTHSLSGATTSANGGFSTSTGSGGDHAHGGSTGADGGQATVQIDAGGPDPVSVSLGPHTHSISQDTGHTHTVSTGDHTHTLSGGTSSDNNPPYLVVNTIILAGV